MKRVVQEGLKSLISVSNDDLLTSSGYVLAIQIPGRSMVLYMSFLEARTPSKETGSRSSTILIGTPNASTMSASFRGQPPEFSIAAWTCCHCILKAEAVTGIRICTPPTAGRYLRNDRDHA